MLFMKNLLRKRRFVALSIVLLLVCIAVYSVFCSFSGSREHIVYIDTNDDIDSIYDKVCAGSRFPAGSTFRLLAAVTGYAHHIHPGRYDVGSGATALSVFRHLRNGSQSPVRLTIPVLRTTRDLADFLGRDFRASSDSFYQALCDTVLLAHYGKTPATALCLFLPNTYELYWTLSPDEVLARMDRESRKFWTPGRKALAAEAGLTPDQAVTLASIVEQETAYNPEKPMVAGMYLNRYQREMPLQADPTVKYALGDFNLRRILHQHLTVDSPYNTYKHKGLPPGPICIPSMASLNAVLHYVKHSYIYMCAKEDFSGSHNFAETYQEHLKNAANYARALNTRGIR